MTKQISLNTLWDSTTSLERTFHSDDYTHLPEAARRYLDHAIASETPLASAVRLRMHGENKRPRRKQRGIATLFLTFHAPQGAGNLPVILLN
jgi:hypothetical protein